MKKFVSAGLLCALWPAAADAQLPVPAPAPVQIDVHRLGPKVGETVPGFELRDQRGSTRTLASVLGPSGGLLVFFRSANW